MILFINPSARTEIYQGLGGSLAAVEPPIWARLLASYCKQKGIEVDILDADAANGSAAWVAEAAQEAKPMLAVIVAHGQQPSASTQLMDSVIATCKAIKELDGSVPVLIIGGHPAALPERTLEETGADAVCTGEGSVTIDQFFKAITSGIDPSVSWGNVAGLCWRAHYDERPVFTNKPAQNVYSLTEEMLGGMWELLPMDKYRAHNWHAFTNGCERKPYASIYTSLGCPFACLFCMIQNPFREGDKLVLKGKANSYRMWHPTHVVNEIERLVTDYGVTNIKIADEMFVLNRSHVLNICQQIIERGLGDKLNMWCYARVDTLGDDALMGTMRAAGIRWVGVGIESMSEHVRDGVGKNDFTVMDIFEACRRLRKHGIHLAANFMFGLLDDTQETMEQTLDMAFEIMPEWCNFYCTVAYPGTALYKQVIAEGWELPASWSGWSHYAYDYLPLRTKHLTAAEVLRFRDEAFQAYYRSPSYQSHVLTKFGPKALVEVQEMVKVPLRRKLLE